MADLDNMFPDEKPNGGAFSFAEVEERLPYHSRTALIDGDMLVYACCFAAAKDDKPFEEVLTIFNAKMNDIMYNSRSSNSRIYLTSDDRSNYRFGLATTLPYKGNRKDREKPKWYAEFREWLVWHRSAIMRYGEEADDRLGIDQYAALIDNLGRPPGHSLSADLLSVKDTPEVVEHTIICTDDKDLNMIPGWHYRLRTQECYFCDEPGHISMDSGDKLWGEGFMFFCGQLLTGDMTDNIPGVGHGADKDGLNEIKVAFGLRRGRGFGPKGVQAVVGTAGDRREAMWRVVQVYRAAHPENWRNRLLEAARLLWIRRYENELWTFPEDIVRYIKEKMDGEPK